MQLCRRAGVLIIQNCDLWGKLANRSIPGLIAAGSIEVKLELHAGDSLGGISGLQPGNA